MRSFVTIAPNTYCVEDGFVRFFVVVGTKRAAVIDTGMTKPDAKQLCGELTNLPLILLNTHGDRDHISGTGGFAEIHIGMEDYENCAVAESFPNTRAVALSDGEIIDLGGRRLKAIRIPGHTKGSFAFLDIEGRMLFAGDSVQDTNIFMFGAHRAPEQFAASLQKLVELQGEYDSIVASHGTVLLAANYARQVLDAWRAVEHGNMIGDLVDVHGHSVLLYQTEACGFYLPIPQIGRCTEDE